ncbi:MAG: N-acetylmuramoyl-L-alanine amidase [Alphaproteobacteria bacterium]
MDILNHPSPNHGPRKGAGKIDMLLLHYTGMPTAGEALERMCDPEAGVSAHYMIDEAGTIFRLVPEERRAWHAGIAHWAGVRDVNSCSVGIELVNPGHEWGYQPFPEPQMAAVEALARDIVTRHAIPATRVLAHSDVAPDRKEDPGELFDWRRLERAGVGVMPADSDLGGPSAATLRPGDEGPAVAELQRRLKAWGYGLSATGLYEETTQAVIRAFQRHYCPLKVDGVACGKTRLALAALLRRHLPDCL